jgi:two-component system, NarL family, sensor kinase
VHSGPTAATGKWRWTGAVAWSRLIAGVAAVCLAAAAVANAVLPDATQLSHPRNWFVAVTCCLLGLRVVAHARRNAVGWVVLAMGFCGAVAVGALVWPDEPWAAWVGNWVWWPGYSLLPVVMLVFPNGRPPSRWWWPVLGIAVLGVVLPAVGLGWASWSDPTSFWPDVRQGTARRGMAVPVAALGFVCFALALVAGLVSLVVRRHRAEQPDRRLLSWTIAGAVAAMASLVLELWSGAVWGAWLVLASAFPVALLVAILWYGLYDITLIIHRTLLYGLVGAVLVAGYSGVVLITTAQVPTRTDVVATVVVVLALAPLYRLLQRTLDRWLYGDRADPYRALTELGRQLEHPLRPDELFPAVAKSIGETLKLPYVAVHLDDGPDSPPLTEYGRSRSWPQHRVALLHRGEKVGELVAEARAQDERLGRRDERLLDDLARQAAPAAHSARLARALRQANERFERERRDELHRIDRDLHDAIGPSVSGIRNQVEAARRMAGDADLHLSRRLHDAVTDLDSLTEQVRELVRNAHPLDLSRGLSHAVRRQAERFDGVLEVHVDVTGDLDGIPPAVESAAYRIVGEALKNVAEHANAITCRIHLRRDADLVEVGIADDGDGIAPDATSGVGLASMRKRCEDLGGTFTVEQSTRGTRITARLPLGPN